jgi:hypothetical protein
MYLQPYNLARFPGSGKFKVQKTAQKHKDKGIRRHQHKSKKEYIYNYIAPRRTRT